MIGGWTGAGVASVRVRATAAATLVVALVLGTVALVLVVVLRGSLVSSADAEAARKAVAAVPYVESLRLASAGQPEQPGQHGQPEQPGQSEQPKGVKGGKGGMVQLRDGRTAPVTDPDLVLTAGKEGPVEWAAPGEYAIAGAKVSTVTGPATLWSRVSLEGVEQALRTLYGTLLPGVPAVLLVVAAMTWLAVGRALAPVAAIRAKVAHITARDLHQRVPVPRSKDEIAALATTVNSTLDRLETAVERHKRFVADAAHELRSPIATLRARLELAAPTDLTREALADVERLQSLAADLLMLAKLDAGEPLRATELDLGQVAAEEALRAGRRPGVRVELDVEPDVVLKGSRAHLDRLVTNLVDNAVRHAASTVRVRVRAEGDEAVLEVLDDGPGIPFEQWEAVFGRFTRLDGARARDAGGAGLGLPIARDIATLHQGTLVYAGGGFVARFPAGPPAGLLLGQVQRRVGGVDAE
ncbi:sensor histidine kinase, partial [Nonomuraea sp. NPDC050783]|uniref:sensor histidine kinase n=1 Tax=Nonomuraea sp. NPDC050783 TaxID=3154634 RepID=UPI003466AAE7